MKRIILFIIVIGSLWMMFSCNSKTRYLYKKEKRNTPDTTYVFHNAPLEYKIQPYDVLYIQIQTVKDEIDNYFQSDSEREQMGDNRFYLSGYTVNDTGYIQVPVIGDFYAQGKTIKELRTEITKRVEEYLTEPIVIVKFVDFKITVLGAVGKQGVMYIYQEKIDILELISRVGGITPNGNFRNVMILRETEQGKLMFRVNLNDRDLLTSEQFYLYPNDMIIVEERQFRKFTSEGLRDFLTILSTVTSTLTTAILVLNFVK